jgi:ketohexokinase
MLYALLCEPDSWTTEDQLGFAVDLASLKVQQEGFVGLGAAMLWARGQL